MDARHAFPNVYTRQAAAAGEGVLPQARHTVRNHNTLQAGTALERTIIIISNALQSIWQCHTLQPGTIIKCTVLNALHALRNLHRLQLRTILKRALADVCHPLRQLHLRQLQAGIKRIVTDIRHSRLHNHRSDFRPLAIPGCHRRSSVIRHGPITGNSQHTVLSQYPTQILAASPRCHNPGLQRRHVLHDPGLRQSLFGFLRWLCFSSFLRGLLRLRHFLRGLGFLRLFRDFRLLGGLGGLLDLLHGLRGLFRSFLHRICPGWGHQLDRHGQGHQ